MTQNDRDRQVAPFPTKLVGVAAVLTLAVLAWLSWFAYDTYKFFQDTNTRIVGLERARGDIIHLDEVLTMSASMAAATGEVDWIDRYRSFEPKLDAAIKQAIDIAQRSDIVDAIRETDVANRELVKMENQAFALVRAGFLDEARAILSGTSYSNQKQLYAGGMKKLLRGLRTEREATIESQQTATVGSILAIGTVGAVVIVAWLIVLGRVREWRTAMSKNVNDLMRAEEALRKSHDDLERRVTDRTRELEDEIAERKRAEKALADQLSLVEALVDTLPSPVFVKDTEARYTILNKAFLESFGGEREDLIGKTVMDVEGRPMEQRRELQQEAEDLIRTGGMVHRETTRVYADGKDHDMLHWETAFELRDGVIGGLVGVSVDITHQKELERELAIANKRMGDELNIGREIQMSMIPREFPPFPDHDEFSIFAALEPAREVGGDFYDFYFLDEERLCVCIGDVSGKGVPAALFMAMAKTLIKSRAADDRSTASILTHVNDELSADNKSAMFVTIFAAIINIRTGKLVYTNAGHNPPYLRRKDGHWQRLDQRHGPVIGAVEGRVYKEERDTMEPGDLLLLYTDGVTEARDSKKQLFSENRLKELLDAGNTDSAVAAVDNTVAAVRAFTGGAEQSDDITVLGLEFHGGSEEAPLAKQQIVIKNHLPEIAVVNEKFGAFAEKFDIPVPVSTKFELILDELLNNVISYAYVDDSDHDIEVRMELAGERLTVTITDDGMPFNPLNVEAPDTGLSLEDREGGGLGIHLVRNLVDGVSYQRGIDKNVMTMVIHL